MLISYIFALFFVSCCTSASYVKVGSFRPDYQFHDGANGWFKLHRIPANWLDARLRCQLEGAVLASPMNDKMLALMKSTIQTQNAYQDRSNVLFTGIHATFSKGDYFSVEGVPLSEIPHSWAFLEPDNKEDSESCIAMYEDGTLADVNCSGVMQYICYRKCEKELVLNECGTIDNEYKLVKETGKCYKFHRNPRTWSRAFMACAAEGGHLAIINSQEEASALSKIFTAIPTKDITVVKNQVLAFIGFHDWGEHGNWVTIHGETLKEAGYSKWGTVYSEPNNVTNADTNWAGEYCGSMYRNAELNDLWCDYVISFICEKDVGTLQPSKVSV